MKVGDKVLSSKYPGVWEIVELDSPLARIKSAKQGIILVTLNSLSPFIGVERQEPLAMAPNELAEYALATSRMIGMYSTPQVQAKMPELGITTRERLFTEIIVSLLGVMYEAKMERPLDILAAAMNIVGAEVNDQEMYDAAEKIGQV